MSRLKLISGLMAYHLAIRDYLRDKIKFDDIDEIASHYGHRITDAEHLTEAKSFFNFDKLKDWDV